LQKLLKKNHHDHETNRHEANATPRHRLITGTNPPGCAMLSAFPARLCITVAIL
jgi:hypothetical protein